MYIGRKFKQDKNLKLNIQHTLINYMTVNDNHKQNQT